MYSLTFGVRVTTPRRMDEMERRTQQARRFYRRWGEFSPHAAPMRSACGVWWALRITAGLCRAFPSCCHSNATCTPIANPPNSAQLGGISYHSAKLHPGPCNSVGMRPRTDTQTDRQAGDHNTFLVVYDSREM